jgi:hypothetical protein
MLKLGIKTNGNFGGQFTSVRKVRLNGLYKVLTYVATDHRADNICYYCDIAKTHTVVEIVAYWPACLTDGL